MATSEYSFPDLGPGDKVAKGYAPGCAPWLFKCFRARCAPAPCASEMRQQIASTICVAVLMMFKRFSHMSSIPTSLFEDSMCLMRLPQNLTSWPYNWAPGGPSCYNWVCAGYAPGPRQGRVRNLSRFVSFRFAEMWSSTKKNKGNKRWPQNGAKPWQWERDQTCNIGIF